VGVERVRDRRGDRGTGKGGGGSRPLFFGKKHHFLCEGGRVPIAKERLWKQKGAFKILACGGFSQTKKYIRIVKGDGKEENPGEGKSFVPCPKKKVDILSSGKRKAPSFTAKEKGAVEGEEKNSLTPRFAGGRKQTSRPRKERKGTEPLTVDNRRKKKNW